MATSSRIAQPSPSQPPSNSSGNPDDHASNGKVAIVVLVSFIGFFALLLIINLITDRYLSSRIRHLRRTAPVRSEAEIARLHRWKEAENWVPFWTLGIVLFDIAQRIERVVRRRVVDVVGDLQLMFGRWRMVWRRPRLRAGKAAGEVDVEMGARRRGCEVCGRP